MIGIEPGPFTFGELSAMFEDNRKHEWAIAAELLAMQINMNRDPRKHDPVRGQDINPYLKREPEKVERKSIQELRAMTGF